MSSSTTRLRASVVATLTAALTLAASTVPRGGDGARGARAPVAGDGPVVKVSLSPIPAIPISQLALSSTHLAGSDQPVPGVSAQDVTPLAAQPTLETGILASLNRIRRGHHLVPLRASTLLSRAAAAHVRALATAGLFQHEWPDGRPFQAWMPRFYPLGRYGYWSAGENLLWSTGSLTPSRALAMWMASPEHRRNILTPGWREIGVGVIHADGAPGAYAGSDVDIAATEFGARRP